MNVIANEAKQSPSMKLSVFYMNIGIASSLMAPTRPSSSRARNDRFRQSFFKDIPGTKHLDLRFPNPIESA